MAQPASAATQTFSHDVWYPCFARVGSVNVPCPGSNAPFSTTQSAVTQIEMVLHYTGSPAYGGDVPMVWRITVDRTVGNDFFYEDETEVPFPGTLYMSIDFGGNAYSGTFQLDFWPGHDVAVDWGLDVEIAVTTL